MCGRELSQIRNRLSPAPRPRSQPTFWLAGAAAVATRCQGGCHVDRGPVTVSTRCVMFSVWKTVSRDCTKLPKPARRDLLPSARSFFAGKGLGGRMIRLLDEQNYTVSPVACYSSKQCTAGPHFLLTRLAPPPVSGPHHLSQLNFESQTSTDNVGRQRKHLDPVIAADSEWCRSGNATSAPSPSAPLRRLRPVPPCTTLVRR